MTSISLSLRDVNIWLVKKARKMTYLVALFLTAIVWFSFAKNGGATVQMANAFGYLAFSFLSLTLIVTPIRTIWPRFELNASLYMARRAIGVSAFVFAVFHYLIQLTVNFNSDLPGLFSLMFSGQGSWLLVGYVALVMLFILFATSFDYAVKKLGNRWFTLHKLVYVAYVFIFLHAYMIGMDFRHGISNAYAGSFVAIAILTLILEAVRVYLTLTKQSVIA